MPLELLSPFIEEAIDLVKRRKKNKKLYNQYLDACHGVTRNLHQEWLPDGGYRLNTMDAFVPVQLRLDNNTRAETISLKAALSDNHRLVIMGLAGAGKSTLSKYIAALLASCHDNIDTRAMENRLKRELGLKPLFPIHIDLTVCNNGMSLDEALFAKACNAFNPTDLVRDELIDGNCFVIFSCLLV